MSLKKTTSIVLAALVLFFFALPIHAESPESESISYYPVGSDLFIVKHAGNKTGLMLCGHTNKAAPRCSKKWTPVHEGADNVKFFTTDTFLYIIRESDKGPVIGSCRRAETGIKPECNGWNVIKPKGR